MVQSHARQRSHVLRIVSQRTDMGNPTILVHWPCPYRGPSEKRHSSGTVSGPSDFSSNDQVQPKQRYYKQKGIVGCTTSRCVFLEGACYGKDSIPGLSMQSSVFGQSVCGGTRRATAPGLDSLSLRVQSRPCPNSLVSYRTDLSNSQQQHGWRQDGHHGV